MLFCDKTVIERDSCPWFSINKVATDARPRVMIRNNLSAIVAEFICWLSQNSVRVDTIVCGLCMNVCTAGADP